MKVRVWRVDTEPAPYNRMGVSDGEGHWLRFDGFVSDTCYEMSPFIANAVVEYANKYQIGQDTPLEEMLELAANNTAAADLAQDVEFLKAELSAANARIDRMRRAWEAWQEAGVNPTPDMWRELRDSHAEDTP